MGPALLVKVVEHAPVLESHEGRDPGTCFAGHAAADTDGADPCGTNPNGGTIALWRPFGATGCIPTTKAVHELGRIDGDYALVAVGCVVGVASGTLLQAVPSAELRFS